jgi:internalin A
MHSFTTTKPSFWSNSRRKLVWKVKWADMKKKKIHSVIAKAIDKARESPKRELHLHGLFFTVLEEIPKQVFEIEDLRSLNISGGWESSGWGKERTNLKELPPDIIKLRNLESLILNKNQIHTLPRELFELENLQTLSLEGNEIQQIPIEIAKLKNLRTLNLSCNQLEELPLEIGELVNLETLDLTRNKLEELPLEIGRLENLSQISVDRNKIKNIPLEILHRSTEAIVNYCKSVLEERVIRLYEAKLLIVGEGGVGKTCLMKRIVNDSFHADELTTEGIDIQQWHFTTKSITNFRVNIWDFGGQEIYHSTHQFFLTKRSLYLFVWTARGDEVNFDYWLNIITLLSAGSPVIVVLNKADERIKMLDERFIQERFKNVVGFHRISALNNTGIEDLVGIIKTEALSLEHVGYMLPKVWAQIREFLGNLDQNFIEYQEYRRICSTYDLDGIKADFLSEYYHDLGVFLHFQDSLVLKGILFLKPDWATNAVYKIIDTKDVIRSYGKFHIDQLTTIWSDYPEDKHLYLIELMKKFELCFQIPDSQEYIIAELLQASSPSFYWNYDNNLRFEYHYDFMPSGIIARFIVINHHLIYEQLYWKNGVVLSSEGTRALIVSDHFNRKIQIWIDGSEKKQLLSIIRDRINYIHRTLNYPTVKEMVRCICSECINDMEPHFYAFRVLHKFYLKDRKAVLCEHSAESVSIELMLGGVEDIITNMEEEILNTLREIKSKYDDDEEGLLKRANQIVQLQPNFMGIGININALIKRLFEKG